ncbi:hypothetical protein DYB26_004116 [Aphanomyces astaci]|uniref:Uncharacterized protein n=1 Tax=Aphanomyces astaci TaxID=112090 RepID=A0A418FKU6_APHAT|nr:hypothetical protein DYB26_004116 [Aphanomyces astaci]
MDPTPLSDIMAWEAMQMSVYLPLTCISMIAACITIFTAFDTKDIRRSAVQYSTYSVFCCDFVWAFLRCVLYILGMIEGVLPTANKGDRNVTNLDERIIAYQAILTAAGDLFIVAGAIWIVLSAYEMQRVVTHTITRLEDRERHTVLFYNIVVYAPLSVLLLLFALGPVSKKDEDLTSSCLRASLYLVVWALFLAVLYLPFAMYKIYCVRQNRSGFFDHTLEHIYRRVRVLLIVYSVTTIPTSIVSLGSEVAQLTRNNSNFLGPHTSTFFFATNCLFYLTGLFNAVSIGGSVLCCIRCLRPVMPKELHEGLMHGGMLRPSDAMLSSENLMSPPLHMPVFIAQALRDEAGTTVNQRHQTVPKLGLRRLKLVGLLVVLVQAKYRAIDAVILSENIIALCLDLFFTFESVNMLHAEIELLVVGILESGGPDLQVGLLKQSNLLGRILQAYETNTAALQESPANAKGYMGHLLRISNVILNITDEVKGVDTRGSLNDMTHADSIVEYLEADPMWAQWDEFVKTTVADANDKDRHALGGSVVSHPVNIQTLSQDDPYGIGRFDHPPIGSFADMLESGDQSHFDTDFDLPQDNDIPAMISDSSSSDEDEDFTEFDPRSIHRSNHPQDSNAIPVVPLDSPDLVMEQADKSMDNSNWANFDAVAPSSQEYVVSCGGACLRSV